MHNERCYMHTNNGDAKRNSCRGSVLTRVVQRRPDEVSPRKYMGALGLSSRLVSVELHRSAGPLSSVLEVARHLVLNGQFDYATQQKLREEEDPTVSAYRIRSPNSSLYSIRHQEMKRAVVFCQFSMGN